MYSKIITLLAVVTASVLLSGCQSKSSPMGQKTTNVLGIVKVEKENYTNAGITTVDIETDQLVGRQDFTGNKYTLLWGLITIKDY